MDTHLTTLPRWVSHLPATVDVLCIYILLA